MTQSDGAGCRISGPPALFGLRITDHRWWPEAHFACARCGHYRRATGRDDVAALIAYATTSHHFECPRSTR